MVSATYVTRARHVFKQLSEFTTMHWRIQKF